MERENPILKKNKKKSGIVSAISKRNTKRNWQFSARRWTKWSMNYKNQRKRRRARRKRANGKVNRTASRRKAEMNKVKMKKVRSRRVKNGKQRKRKYRQSRDSRNQRIIK